MPKKARVNLTVDGELLDEARRADINLSETLEDALADRLREARWTGWREENAEAIRSYNEHVAKHGVFGARFRRF